MVLFYSILFQWAVIQYQQARATIVWSGDPLAITEWLIIDEAGTYIKKLYLNVVVSVLFFNHRGKLGMLPVPLMDNVVNGHEISGTIFAELYCLTQEEIHIGMSQNQLQLLL